MRNMLRILFSKSLQVASPKTMRNAFIITARTAGTVRSSHPKLALRKQTDTVMLPILNSISDGGDVCVCLCVCGGGGVDQ